MLKNPCNATGFIFYTHDCKSHSWYIVAEGWQSSLVGRKVLPLAFFSTSALAIERKNFNNRVKKRCDFNIPLLNFDKIIEMSERLYLV